MKELKAEKNTFQQYFDETPTSCPMCDSNDHIVLGILGYSVKLRCRACGWDFGRKIPKTGKAGN